MACLCRIRQLAEQAGTSLAHPRTQPEDLRQSWIIERALRLENQQRKL